MSKSCAAVGLRPVLVLLVAGAGLCAAHGAGAGDGPSEVVVLDDNNFGRLTQHGIWFVNFYAPWCGHCKRVMPIWEAAAVELKKKDTDIRMAKIDADAESEVAESFKIQAYPTFKIIHLKEVSDFKGEHTVESFINFALDFKKKLSNKEKAKKEKETDDGVLALVMGLAWTFAEEKFGLYTTIVWAGGFFFGLMCGVLFAVREKEKLN